jgi:uncharacterized protein YbaR (Trm112 family)
VAEAAATPAAVPTTGRQLRLGAAHWRYLIGSATASPYLSGLGFCPRCQLWFRLDSVPRNRRGAPVCPRCRTTLRTRPLRTNATRAWREYRRQRSVRVSRRG